MPKRGAELEMNHENYEDPLPEEEAGEFVKAGDTVIRTRKIIKAARRRGPETAVTGNEAEPAQPIANPFKGFSFGSAAFAPLPVAKPLETAAPAAVAASQLATKASELSSAASVAAPLGESKPQNGEKAKTEGNVEMKSAENTAECAAKAAQSEQTDASRRTNAAVQTGCRTYLKHLRKLNEDLLSWLSTNLRSNPYCILSPMFADYGRHVDEIERKYHVGPCSHHPNADDKQCVEQQTVKSESHDVPDGPLAQGAESLASRGLQFAFKDDGASKPFRFGDSGSTPAFSGFSFAASSNAGAAASSGFSFGVPASSAAPTFGSGAPLFSGVFAFKPTSTSTSTSSTPFVFGAATSSSGAESDTKPKSLEAAKQAADAETEQREDAEEGEYEPPKAERIEQREADASFSVRCKLLYRQLGAASASAGESDVLTKGVGTLSLKSVDNPDSNGEPSGKLQLIVRAETALATVLLNLLVARNSLLRLTRNESSKSVAFVAVPNPPFDTAHKDKPAQIFVRVKTTEECNSLFEHLSRVVNAS